jgi:hypothetical protein
MTQPIEQTIVPPHTLDVPVAVPVSLPPGIEQPVVLDGPPVPTRRVLARVRRVEPARQDLAVTEEELAGLGETVDD